MTDVELLLNLSSADTAKGLAALSVADSLTDDLALRLLATSGVDEAGRVLQTLQGCNFVIHRNREWRLSEPARKLLQGRLSNYPELETHLNRELLEVWVASALERNELAHIPSYLSVLAGAAYHAAAIDVEQGLNLYSVVARSDEPSATWLGSRLVSEQTERGIVPADATQVQFLRGMALYREGRVTEGVSLLRPVAVRQEESIDVAMACHLVGRYDVHRHRDVQVQRGLKLLRRSRAIGQKLDDVIHIIHASHTLGLALLQQNSSGPRRAGGFDLLRESLDMAVEVDDAFSQAQILNTWGQALSRSEGRADRVTAEGMLRRSLELGEQLENPYHQSQVLISLAKLVGRSSPSEARRLLEQARALGADTDTAEEGLQRPVKGHSKSKQRRKRG